MCETDVRRGCHHDPLSLLKNCDATALGKLCETVSGMGNDTVAYANFPKRSLVSNLSKTSILARPKNKHGMHDSR